MLKMIQALLLTLTIAVAQAAEVTVSAPPPAEVASCVDRLTPYGMPSGPNSIKTTNLCRRAYLLRHYDECKGPLLVTEFLQAKNVGGTEARGSFHPDPDLPKAVRGETKSYYKSGFDMGHLAPAADFKDDRAEMDESFYLSNASPQVPAMNRGIWRMIEMRVRAQAVKQNDVYVITGVIYDQKPERMVDGDKNDSGICIGSAYYKVVIDKKTGDGSAYIVKNIKDFGPNDPDQYMLTIAELEKQTGINFTPNLPRSTAKNLKNK